MLRAPLFHQGLHYSYQGFILQRSKVGGSFMIGWADQLIQEYTVGQASLRRCFYYTTTKVEGFSPFLANSVSGGEISDINVYKGTVYW